MYLARVLATFVFQTKSIPKPTQVMVNHVVLDLITAAIAGSQTKGATAARTAATALWGAGTSAVWFSNIKLPAAGAAFVNSAITSMLDLDDGHRAAAGHPGAAIIPAVFAEADNGNYSGEQLSIAIALGYEIAVRISAARDFSQVDTLVSGRWCAQGVAAAVGWLRELSVEQLTQALSIAAASAPNLTAVAYSNDMGNHVKEGIPWATATGIAAVELAAAGSTGPSDFLDNTKVFDPNKLTGNLGVSWMIDGVYFKPYSCCRWAHAAMDATQSILTKHDLKPEDITRISIRTFSRALQLNNDVAPRNLQAAQYSVPFCVALAAVRGPAAFLPLTEASLHDSTALELSAKIDLHVDPELDVMFSASVPAEVRIRTEKSQHASRVLTPKGEPTNPMAHSDLLDKFDIVTKNIMRPEHSRAFKVALDGFANFEPEKLRHLLAMPIA